MRVDGWGRLGGRGETGGGMEGEESRPQGRTDTRHGHFRTTAHYNTSRSRTFALPPFRTNPKLLLLNYLVNLGERKLSSRKKERRVLEKSVDREAAVREHVVRGTDGGGEVRGSRAVWWC